MIEFAIGLLGHRTGDLRGHVPTAPKSAERLSCCIVIQSTAPQRSAQLS